MWCTKTLKNALKTRCQLVWWFGFQSVDKIQNSVSHSKSLQISIAFYHVNPHFHSFPTMYNTWGLRIQESSEKNGRTQKMLVFLQISLPFFLITYAWERVATFFVLSTLHWWAYSVMAWCLVEKWAIGKLVWLWFHRVSSVSLKYVTYRQKITKIRFWALNSIFHTYFVYVIMLAYTTEKLGP